MTLSMGVENILYIVMDLVQEVNELLKKSDKTEARKMLDECEWKTWTGVAVDAFDSKCLKVLDFSYVEFPEYANLWQLVSMEDRPDVAVYLIKKFNIQLSPGVIVGFIGCCDRWRGEFRSEVDFFKSLIP